MEIIDLSKSIEEQYTSLRNFFEIIMEQQKAIINNDVAGMESSIKAQGALLIDIKQKEKRVGEVINDLSNKYSLEIKSCKLPDFISAAKNRHNINLKVISELNDSLKKLILQIMKANNQNKILIEHARNFIKELVVLLKLKNNTILDRKI